MSKRREFSKRVRLQAWERAQGRCENPSCGLKVDGTNVEYHHVKEDTFGGEPTLENCQVLCRPCHSAVTGQQAKVIAKSNRVRNAFIGIKKKKRTIPGRRFDGTPVPARWK